MVATLIAVFWMLGAAGPARAQEDAGAELLRPLSVDLRRLYPQLASRWDVAETRRYDRTKRGFEPSAGFLAAPDSPRASIPAEAGGTLSIRQGRLRVEQRLLGTRAAPAVAEGGLIRFRGAYPHTEALYVADAASVEQLFLLADPRAPTRFVSDVRVSGGRLSAEADGALAVYDEREEPAMRLSPPVVLDAHGRRRRGEWNVRPGRPGAYTVTLSFDPAGLEYPLLID